MPASLRISDLSRIAARLALVACVIGSGCGHTAGVPRFPRGEAPGNQGASWELVLGSPATVIAQDWEVARLDDALNVRGPEPDQARPHLEDLRRIYLNPRPDQIYYYRFRGY